MSYHWIGVSTVKLAMCIVLTCLRVHFGEIKCCECSRLVVGVSTVTHNVTEYHLDRFLALKRPFRAVIHTATLS